MARSSAPPTIRPTSITKPQSSSARFAATKRRVRFAVPDTSGRGTAITPNTVPGRSTDTADVGAVEGVGCQADPGLPRLIRSMWKCWTEAHLCEPTPNDKRLIAGSDRGSADLDD